MPTSSPVSARIALFAESTAKLASSRESPASAKANLLSQATTQTQQAGDIPHKSENHHHHTYVLVSFIIFGLSSAPRPFSADAHTSTQLADGVERQHNAWCCFSEYALLYYVFLGAFIRPTSDSGSLSIHRLVFSTRLCGGSHDATERPIATGPHALFASKTSQTLSLVNPTGTCT